MVKPRILIIEDDLEVARLLETIFVREGFEVAVARDGAAGIERLEDGPWPVILLDLMMPGVNGFHVISYLEATDRDALKRRVIVLTAAGSVQRRELNAEAVYKVIDKPFDVDELIAAVRKCVAAIDAQPAPKP